MAALMADMPLIQRLILASVLSSVPLSAGGPCEAFRADLTRTYAFRPSQLSTEAMDAKGKEMDAIWTRVVSDRSLIPCLERAVDDPSASQSLRYDGSALLVHVDPSPAHKAMQAKWWCRTDLADTDPQAWVQTLAEFGSDGFDTEEGAVRWMETPNAHYYLPEHGGWEITQEDGAIFLVESMDENRAFSMLKTALADPKFPARDLAARMMYRLGTRDACAYLLSMDLSGLGPSTRKDILSLRKRHQLVDPRRGAPSVSREAFLAAFKAFVDKGDLDPFMNLADRVKDGERDAVTVLAPEDLPLLRAFRRHLMARCNPHLIELDQDLMRILVTLSWPKES